MKAQVNQIMEGLKHFNGSELFYQTPLIRTRYTNGLKYLANVADCYWLITDISVIAKSLIDFKRLSEEDQDFSGYEAEITYSDGNGTIFETYRYNFTDFPLDELRLFFVDGTLMLPSEY